MTLNIYSLNINGLRSNVKQVFIKDFISDNDVDILCIQETHIDNFFVVKRIEQTFSQSYKYIWSYGHGQSCGTCVIIVNDKINLHSYQTDFDGRFIYADISIFDTNFRLCTLYAPNVPGERNDFFDNIKQFLVTSRTLILCGDFNFVVNTKLDKIGGNLETGTFGSKSFNSIIKSSSLIDAFRYKYPDKVNITWSRNNVGCRIDRFYLPSSYKQYISDCGISPCALSDHDFIYTKLVLNNNISIGKSYWKLNNSILLDEDFVKGFKFYWKIISRTPYIDLEWWDKMKRLIKEFCIDYSKCKRRKFHKNIRSISLQYQQSNDVNEKSILKSKLHELYMEKHRGAVIRSKVNIIDGNENISSYLHDVESSKGRKKTIHEIIDDDSVKSTSSDILHSFRKFYINLYTSEPIDTTLYNDFLDNLPQVSSDDNSDLIQEITVADIETILKQMDHTKTPGSDGLTSLFYLKFIDIFGPVLVKIFNLCYEKGSMSNSQKISYITLLCKNENNATSMRNYRPISLLNIDRKLLSKIITNRLTNVLPSVIGISQTCSIKGRSIFDNIHLIRNVIDYIEQKNIGACFISLDQEKAFDRVSWPYMYKVLESFGFDNKFIHWIKVIYADISSSVIVNGHISEPFVLERSVRQGCSLSPLLYALCLEPLAKKVQEDTNINGVVAPGGKFHVKMSLYADDNSTFLTDDRSIHLFSNHVYNYQKMSGSKINYNKSSGMFLGKWKNRKDSPFGIRWVENNKVLGYKFGYNLTDDDLWHILYVKFSNTLNLWSSRRMSFKGKSNILNTFATSKILYYVFAQEMPHFYQNMFQRSCFRFIWKTTFEPIARKTLYLPFKNGGLNIPCINTKIKAFYLSHICRFLNDDDIPWKYFTTYWIGIQLRKYKLSLASNSMPHSDTVPSFYVKCLQYLREYESLSTFTHHSLSSKNLYSAFINTVEPKCVREAPHINFQNTFNNIFSKAIDSYCRNTCYKIAHNVLYVNAFLSKFIRSTPIRCTFCSSPETITHLLLQCKFTLPLNRLCLYLIHLVTNGNALFREKWFRYFDVSADPNIKYVILILLAESRCIIWRARNEVKKDKIALNSHDLAYRFINRIRYRIFLDFKRLHVNKFYEHWSDFCVIENDNIRYFSVLDKSIYCNA